MPNIVQAEFFHIGGRGSVETLHRQYADRVQYRAPMKTTVRFYDEGGFVTEFVTRYLRANARMDELIKSYWAVPRWKKPIVSLLVELSQLQAIPPHKRWEEAYGALDAIASTSREIALECDDRSFRPIHDDERYDVLNAARKAKSAWIFVFAPNELCADQNTIIASAM